jgi:hypothetical protein
MGHGEKNLPHPASANLGDKAIPSRLLDIVRKSHWALTLVARRMKIKMAASGIERSVMESRIMTASEAL